MDNITQQRVNLLHPILKDEVIKTLTLLENKGIFVRISQGLRTFTEQTAIYEQGRSLPGNIVTNAKAGQSFHNYGLAFDFCLLHKDGTVSWSEIEDANNDKQADFMEVIEEFEKIGWTSGFWWKHADKDHLEKPFGHTFEQLLALDANRQTDENGYVII